MKSRVIVDTGPLVTLLNKNDAAQRWTVLQLQAIAPPMLTCEAVPAEATYLTRGMPSARAALVAPTKPRVDAGQRLHGVPQKRAAGH